MNCTVKVRPDIRIIPTGVDPRNIHFLDKFTKSTLPIRVLIWPARLQLPLLLLPSSTNVLEMKKKRNDVFNMQLKSTTLPTSTAVRTLPALATLPVFTTLGLDSKTNWSGELHGLQRPQAMPITSQKPSHTTTRTMAPVTNHIHGTTRNSDHKLFYTK